MRCGIKRTLTLCLAVLIIVSLFHLRRYHFVSRNAYADYNSNTRSGEDQSLVITETSGTVKVLADNRMSENNFQQFMDRKSSENRKRLKLLSWYCQSEESLKSLPAPSRMYDIPAFNMSLTLIAKVASTSWVALMAKSITPQCVKHIDIPSAGYATLHDCVKNELSLQFNHHRLPVRAVFVRNPWRRLVSVYEDKISKQRFVQADSCYKRWNTTREALSTDSPNLSFAQFVTCIIETNNPEHLDPHWRPQYLMHGSCAADYTHIGRLEEVDDDFLYIVKSAQPNISSDKLLGYLKLFRDGLRRPWEVTNSVKKQGRFIGYYKSLSDKSLSLLQDLYKWDVLLYSYKLNPLNSS